MTLLLAALALLSAAVCAGLLLAFIALRAQRSSLPLALSHAVLALASFGFLIAAIMDRQEASKLFNMAALLQVMALFGGAVLLALRISKREYRTPPPMFVVVLHALMGIGALIALVVGQTRG